MIALRLSGPARVKPAGEPGNSAATKTKSGTDLIQFVTDLALSKAELTKSRTDKVKSVADLTKSTAAKVKSGTDLMKSKANLV